MKACVFTLGCKMNEVESRSIMQGLEERGYEVTDALEYADVYFLNTCAVTQEAEKKSRQAVARVLKFNPQAKVVVFGCASAKNAQAFCNKQGVVFVSGAQGKNKVLSLLGQEGVFPDEGESAFCELPYPKRTKTRAFLRIEDGCNNFCSYCIIPYLRGRVRSRSADSIVSEASQSGAKEIVLTGIDISSYCDNGITLGGLLARLKNIPARIRLGSLEQKIITREFLQQVKDAGNVTAHFHLSLQSGSNAVLKAMNRHYTREEYLEKCALVYKYFPEAAITTDIIAGFAGETDEDFQNSLSIIKEAGFARVHAFPYSPREGTAAYKREDTPAEIKKRRTALLMQEGARAEQAFLQKQVGREAVALFEADGGYTQNYVRVTAAGAQEGALCRVKIVKAEQHGVQAEILERLN